MTRSQAGLCAEIDRLQKEILDLRADFAKLKPVILYLIEQSKEIAQLRSDVEEIREHLKVREIIRQGGVPSR